MPLALRLGLGPRALRVIACQGYIACQYFRVGPWGLLRARDTLHACALASGPGPRPRVLRVIACRRDMRRESPTSKVIMRVLAAWPNREI